jgi:hypothetical protein
LSFEYGVAYLFRAGNDRRGFYSNLELNEHAPRMTAPARLLNGELMIPVYDPAVAGEAVTGLPCCCLPGMSAEPVG